MNLSKDISSRRQSLHLSWGTARISALGGRRRGVWIGLQRNCSHDLAYPFHANCICLELHAVFVAFILPKRDLLGPKGTCCFLEVLHFFDLISSSGAGTGYAGVPRILLAYLHLIIAPTWAHFQSLDRSVLVRLASTGLVCLDRHALSAVCFWSLLLT